MCGCVDENKKRTKGTWKGNVNGSEALDIVEKEDFVGNPLHNENLHVSSQQEVSV